MVDLLRNGFPLEKIDAVGAYHGGRPVATAMMHAAASRGLELDAFVVRKAARRSRREAPDRRPIRAGKSSGAGRQFPPLGFFRRRPRSSGSSGSRGPGRGGDCGSRYGRGQRIPPRRGTKVLMPDSMTWVCAGSDPTAGRIRAKWDKGRTRAVKE